MSSSSTLSSSYDSYYTENDSLDDYESCSDSFSNLDADGIPAVVQIDAAPSASTSTALPPAGRSRKLRNFFTGSNANNTNNNHEPLGDELKDKTDDNEFNSEDIAVFEEEYERRLEASGYFALLSDEIITKIYGFVPINSLGRLAQTCQRMAIIVEDVPLLAERAKRDNWLMAGSIPTNSRSFYKESFKDYRLRQKKAARTRRINELATRKRKDSARARRFYVAMFGFFWEFVSIVIFWICLIRAVLRLDGGIESSWASILMPLLLPAFQLTFGNFMFNCFLYTFQYSGFNEDSVNPEDGFFYPAMFYFLFVWPAQKDFSPLATILNLPTGVALCLIIFKLSLFAGTIEFPYLYCAAPIIVQSLILFFAFIFKKLLPWSSYHYERIFSIIFSLLWAVFVTLLACKLDGLLPETMNWYHVFIPVFVAQGLFVWATLMALCLSCLPCCDECMEDNSWWNEYDSPCENCYVAFPFHAVVTTNILVFEYLLVSNLMFDRYDSYGVIFIPIFVLMGLLTFGWMIGRIIIGC